MIPLCWSSSGGGLDLPFPNSWLTVCNTRVPAVQLVHLIGMADEGKPKSIRRRTTDNYIVWGEPQEGIETIISV